MYSRPREGKGSVVIDAGLPCTFTGAGEGVSGSLGVEEGSSVERYAEDEFIAFDALRNVPINGGGCTERAAVKVGLVVRDVVPGTS